MPRQIAVKRLTRSDLTLFEWQLRNDPAGTQKAINLNADALLRMYPAMPDIALRQGNRFPLDLYLYGPDARPELNLQRKILKQQKNWRLNGEIIANPVADPTRFDSLAEHDIAVFEFQGDLVPVAARVVFLAASSPIDAPVHAQMDLLLGTSRMAVSDSASVSAAVEASGVADAHPIWGLLLDDAIEDAVQGGAEGLRRLFRRGTRTLTREDLRRAREGFDAVGRVGEELVYEHLVARQEAGQITSFEWEADANAAAPFDFSVVAADGTVVLIDVKTTGGPHERAVHVSMSEIITMAQHEGRYDLYRVSRGNDGSYSVRVAEDCRAIAQTILDSFQTLPPGVRPDGVTIANSALTYGESVALG